MAYMFACIILNLLILGIVPKVKTDNESYARQYCTATEYCAEGTHVACMYMDQNHIKGPQCVNPIDIEITPHIKNTVLEEVNKIRSKLALGSETGKNDKRLPRAYGMNKMLWDNELAFFAQLWANQCQTKKDLCRFTSRFPKPGQIIAEVRFSYPNWQRHGVTSTTLTPQDNVLYAFIAAIKSWYSLKSYVDDEKIANSEYLGEGHPLNDYLTMVQGSNTHMGCGVSAFTKEIFGNPKSNVVNVILVVCNFNAELETGQPLYAMQNKNYDRGHCGCPKGTEEDFDCLCNGTPETYYPSSINMPNQEKEKKSLVMTRIGDYIEDSTGLTKIDTEPTDSMKLVLKVKALEKPIANFLKKKLSKISNVTNQEEVYKYMADPNNLPETSDGVKMRRPIKAIITSPSDFEDAPNPGSKEDDKQLTQSDTSLQKRFIIKPSARKAMYPSQDPQAKSTAIDQTRPVLNSQGKSTTIDQTRPVLNRKGKHNSQDSQEKSATIDQTRPVLNRKGMYTSQAQDSQEKSTTIDQTRPVLNRKGMYTSQNSQAKSTIIDQNRPVFNPSESKTKYLPDKHNHRRYAEEDDDSNIDNLNKMNPEQEYQDDLDRIQRAGKQSNYKKDVLPKERKTVDMLSKGDITKHNKATEKVNNNSTMRDGKRYTKIIDLLNNLEAEIRNAHLDAEGRKIVDEKIKKLYNKDLCIKKSKPELPIIESKPPRPRKKPSPSRLVKRNRFSKYITGFKGKSGVHDQNDSQDISFEDILKDNKDDKFR